MELPIGEELEISVTKNLEEDIRELFKSLYFDKSWYYKGKPKHYRVVFWFQYQPLIAKAPSLTRKYYYLLEPILVNNAVTSWQIIPISWVRSLLLTFKDLLS